MKTKIIVGLAIYAIIFLCGGLYVLHLIGSTARQTDALIMLHQVEILREHYLLQIRRVQTDLALRDTRFARDIDTSIAHVVSMERVIDTCFDCHHARPVVDRLAALKAQTRNYQELISRVMTIRANEARLLSEKESAFQAGEKLIEQVSDMIALTGARLQASTRRALASIRRTTVSTSMAVESIRMASSAERKGATSRARSRAAAPPPRSRAPAGPGPLRPLRPRPPQQRAIHGAARRNGFRRDARASRVHQRRDSGIRGGRRRARAGLCELAVSVDGDQRGKAARPGAMSFCLFIVFHDRTNPAVRISDAEHAARARHG